MTLELFPNIYITYREEEDDTPAGWFLTCRWFIAADAPVYGEWNIGPSTVLDDGITLLHQHLQAFPTAITKDSLTLLYLTNIPAALIKNEIQGMKKAAKAYGWHFKMATIGTLE